MNKNTIQTLVDKIDQIKSINLFENALTAFPNEDLENMQATNDFSIAQAIRLIERCISQFEEAFANPENQILPFTISVPEVDGNGSSTLLQRLDELYNYAQARDTSFNQVGSSLRWLISYQQMFGFWDKSEKKIHFVDELKLKEQQKELAVLSKKLSEVLKSAEFVTLSHSSNITQLEELIRAKNEEFASLANMVGKATNESSQITQFWEQAHRQNSEIDNLKNQANQVLDSIRKQLSEQEKEFKQLMESLDTGKDNLADTIADALSKLSDIDQAKESINERLEEAKRLLGLSGDAALGGKFSQRELAVRGSLPKWLNRIAGSSAIAVLWAVVVFTCLSAKTENAYLNVLINLIKTGPGFLLMGFVISQYNKERALEEEYAFRAAVAETINAYADLLAGKDNSEKNVNESRQKMLLDAIKQVYAKPQMHKENVSAREYKKATSELMDVLKSIVSKG